MQYKVVPFTASIVRGQGAEAAAQQLAELINQNAGQGWEYVRLENVRTIITTPAVPGNAGCLGIGATPGTPASHDEAVVYMIVFRK
jgi:hypothetical protein